MGPENDEWQSCMQLMRVRLADAMGLTVSGQLRRPICIYIAHSSTFDSKLKCKFLMNLWQHKHGV